MVHQLSIDFEDEEYLIVQDREVLAVVKESENKTEDIY